LEAVNNLGRLLADQGKLVEAEPLYIRALQGYEALESVNISSYTPALETMFNLGELYSVTERMEMAKEMYNRALSGYTTVQGPSSKWCRQLENQLQALQVASTASKTGQVEPKEIGAPKSMSLKRKLSASWGGG
jgi:tetratricopeptide (TPR) repeat protein